MSKCSIPGKTDLATVNPVLANEWHPTLNGELRPSDVTVSSNKKVWWHCKENHEWQANVYNRSHGSDCPYCSGKKAIPGKTDLATVNPVLAEEWHPTLNGDLKPSDVTIKSGKKVWWYCKGGHEWQTRVSDRSKGSDCPYCTGKKAIPGETDLATKNPVLAAEWHPTLNGDLKPSDVTVGSGKKVWWCCKKGHVWNAVVSSRSDGKDCPYCAGSRAIPGETDLATVNPVLAKEWHPTLNGDLKPSDVSIKSHKKVWWYCKRGHEWQARVSDRSNGRDCPYCTGRRAIPGETDLATVNPVLAKEWHPNLNGDLKPSDVTVKSDKKVWWCCKEGHEWLATIGNRSNGSDCPYCTSKKVIHGETDLATVNPVLAAEWHPTLNGDLKPSDVTTKSNKKVWWRCKEGHEWIVTVSNRSNGSDCPYCNGRYPIPGETDLTTVNPILVAERHPTLNGDLKPSDVTISSGKKVWWCCEKGHEWQARVSDRNNGSDCPYCARKRAFPGETDLATVNPVLAAEWHPTLNGDLKPSDVTDGSVKKVWWCCEKSHEWQARVSERSNGNECPYCHNKKYIYKNRLIKTT